MPEAFPDAVISFPMLGESFALDPARTYTLFGHTFYWYGVIIGLGFLLGVIFCFRRGPRDFGVSTDTLTDVILIGMPAMLIGSRILYCLCHYEQYMGQTPGETVWNWCRIWEGGSAIAGGIVLTAACVWIYSLIKKIPVGAIADASVFGLMLGLIVGRWSNFINREYLGTETTVFCRMGLSAGGNTIYVHPLFLYESLAVLAAFIALYLWNRKGLRQFDGEITLMFMLGYSLLRMLLEPLCFSPLVIPGSEMLATQLVMAGVFSGSACLYFKTIGERKTKEQLYVNQVRSAVSAEAEAPAPDAAPAAAQAALPETSAGSEAPAEPADTETT
ncbi:MAG: prolipoprotein diacylglyceryl transferase [Oscillospiraceae bacterium]|nr:prolipoprotein diacylglyceryl transferase [Oscillospiraceae bacterium]